MEELKAELDRELQSERKKLQEEKEGKLASLKQVTPQASSMNTNICLCVVGDNGATFAFSLRSKQQGVNRNVTWENTRKRLKPLADGIILRYSAGN